MNKKAIIIVLDSVGIGELPDAAAYGDKGADTLGHIINTCHPELPNMMSRNQVSALLFEKVVVSTAISVLPSYS